MDFEAVIKYLYEQIPMFQRIGKAAYKANLDNTWLFCEELGQPQNKFPSIHIAGTNGKGSSSHLIAAVLQSAGYKTGLYTSPHLKSFTERIRINGVEIPNEEVCNFVNQRFDFIERVKPSFFEITVAMAFDYFAKERVDIAVIEVGMGGRLDSTNVIHPLLSLITNISFDHQEFLGDTLPKIASEKAGIIKPGIPVVISEYQEEVVAVFKEKAALEKADIYFAEKVFQPQIVSAGLDTQSMDVQKLGKPYLQHLELGLLGQYQEKNIAGVLQAIALLGQKGYHLSEENIRKGLKEVVSLTGLKGRWQILQKKPLILCDTAHNISGILIAMNQLSRVPRTQLHFVLGSLKDKDLDSILPLFPKDAIYYFCSPNVPRGLDVRVLKERAAEFGLIGESYSSVVEAIHQAKSNLAMEDVLFIGGSTFVVAEIEEL